MNRSRYGRASFMRPSRARLTPRLNSASKLFRIEIDGSRPRLVGGRAVATHVGGGAKPCVRARRRRGNRDGAAEVPLGRSDVSLAEREHAQVLERSAAPGHGLDQALEHPPRIFGPRGSRVGDAQRVQHVGVGGRILRQRLEDANAFRNLPRVAEGTPRAAPGPAGLLRRRPRPSAARRSPPRCRPAGIR